MNASMKWKVIFTVARPDGSPVLTIERMCPYDTDRLPSEPPEIYVTDLDYKRLGAALAAADRDAHAKMLLEELSRATIVASDQIPPDVVTMNSKVRFKDVLTGIESEVTLCYPSMADPEIGNISVLAPVGAALLGLKSGDQIEWPMPAGKKRLFRVISVPHQPEALGAFDPGPMTLAREG